MKKKESEELLSLNDTLCDELYVKELEERLETDPLLVGGLMNFVSGDGFEAFGSTNYQSCPFLFVSCGEYN